jgi:hypothetical protein
VLGSINIQSTTGGSVDYLATGATTDGEFGLCVVQLFDAALIPIGCAPPTRRPRRRPSLANVL